MCTILTCITCATGVLPSEPGSWQQLADALLHMPTSEAIYLLTTFANMAACRSSEEEHFIRTVTLEVFEVSWVRARGCIFVIKVGQIGTKWDKSGTFKISSVRQNVLKT